MIDLSKYGISKIPSYINKPYYGKYLYKITLSIPEHRLPGYRDYYILRDTYREEAKEIAMSLSNNNNITINNKKDIKQTTDHFKIVCNFYSDICIYTVSQSDAEYLLSKYKDDILSVTMPYSKSHVKDLDNKRNHVVCDRLFFGCYRYKLKFNCNSYRELLNLSKSVKDFMETSYPEAIYNYTGTLGKRTWCKDLYIMEDDTDLLAVLSMMFDITVTKAVLKKEIMDDQDTE